MHRSRKRKSRARQPVVVLRRRVPVASALLVAISAAYAQDSNQTGALPEIIVTAQKRDERLQDVPIAIQALSTEKLEQLRISDFDDYVKFLPSVSYQQIAPGFARVFMRGVSSGDNGNHSGPLPSVGMYLDEQPITTIQGPLDIHLYDIARVETLAGPQGTLYGASSQAGTIRIITNKPDLSGFSGGYDLEGNTVTGGDEGYQAEGFVNIPLSDTMAVRLVGWYRHDAGYIDNILGSRTYPTLQAATGNGTENNLAMVEDNYNEVDTTGARAALRINLNDNWTVTPTFMFQHQEADGSFGYDLAARKNALSHYYEETSTDDWYQASLTVEGKLSNWTVTYAGSYLDRDDTTNSDYSDYSEFYDVFYQNSPSYFGSYFTDNADQVINPGQYIQGTDGYTKQSHELRFASPEDYRVRFVGGIFYQVQKHDIEQRYLVNNLNDASEVTGWPDTFWLTEQERRDEDKAVFGEVTVDIIEQLSVTAGLREFESNNSLKGFYGFGLTNPYNSATGEQSCTSAEQINGGPCVNLDKGVADWDDTYKFNMTYRPTDDLLFYATYSTGYRPGGVNRRGTYPPYEPDFLDNYELGWKTTWADGRLRFNGAAFLQKWDNFQFSFTGDNGLTNVTNAGGGAQIPGVEMDVEWAVIDGLTLSGGFMWLKPELTGDFCELLDANGKELPSDQCRVADDDLDKILGEEFAPDGTTLPVTPKLKFNLVGRYEFDIGGFDSHVQASYVYQGSSRSGLTPAENSQLGRQDSYEIVDMSAGLGKDSWSVELFVDNVFDENADLYRFTECNYCVSGLLFTPPNTQAGNPYTEQRVYAIPYQPRTIGLRFGQKF